MSGNGPGQVITKGEREDLQRLIRQRERVLKSAAKQRSAELVADFENQMGSEFSFDDDAVWAKAKEQAHAEIRRAKQRIAARCRELGIPDRFAPTLHLTWLNRGYDNAVAQRRAELRRIAQTKIAAIEQKAATEIELSCLEAQTQLAVAGLTSEVARAFVDRLPGIEALMPRLTFFAVTRLGRPTARRSADQRRRRPQRRYRERQAALRDAEALRALPSADDASPEIDGAAP